MYLFFAFIIAFLYIFVKYIDLVSENSARALLTCIASRIFTKRVDLSDIYRYIASYKARDSRQPKGFNKSLNSPKASRANKAKLCFSLPRPSTEITQFCGGRSLACYKPFFIAMALTRNKKEHIVGVLEKAGKEAASVVFVNFHGLGVSETNEMRKALREQGVTYTVARKTLIRRALEEQTGGSMPELAGEVAVAYGADPVVPASTIATFAKKYKDNLKILGGIFEGTFKNQSEMEMIASIPGMDVLRGMFVNVINSPIAGLAVALNAIAEKKESSA